jgi:hypothetical protein
MLDKSLPFATSADIGEVSQHPNPSENHRDDVSPDSEVASYTAVLEQEPGNA